MRKGEELKAFRYASAAATRDYIIVCDIIPNNKTFTLVIKPISYKLLFIIVVVNNFEIEQMDIKMAFLYSDIDTKIYIKQSKEIKAIRELYKVYKLNKVLYSLKQLLYI